MTISKNVWKVAAFLLILCLVSTVMISGTYAKYTSTYAGQDTALVAKWDIFTTGGGIGLTEGGTADLDLFHHTYSNVAAKVGDKYIIAPGVAGKFILEFDNNSDVTADITFEIATTSAVTVPIEYSLNNFGDTLTLDQLESELNGATSAFHNIIANTGPVTETVSWRWVYDVNPLDPPGDAADIADTQLGTDSADAGHTEYGLNITATADQVLPQ
ncbi:MAG TPA: hypothetical protein VM577_02215 [Anaerovoracaceae bacterium]|nr:hypothetical protein [Anaerovoracaceae bacterium]